MSVRGRHKRPVRQQFKARVCSVPPERIVHEADAVLSYPCLLKIVPRADPRDPIAFGRTAALVLVDVRLVELTIHKGPVAEGHEKAAVGPVLERVTIAGEAKRQVAGLAPGRAF